ncbi:MAG TPA: histidine phosphatase family protein [Gemmatimonadaceae bacterium]|nr:histidine phosphatase family protein [Gemmatimonadaceae bacterium]
MTSPLRMANNSQRWPDLLWIVRHGESAGNVARDAADAAGLQMIDIDVRDVDVLLSPLGERQAEALGRWFATLPDDRRPTVVLVSPYQRALRTAEIVRDAGGLCPEADEFVVDERLREKEFGILDRLTRVGIEHRHPEQAELRRLLGKFYHRPPGGESWCDVILRLRSALDTISLHYARGERVLIVCHQVIVLCLRYLVECMSEEQILEIDRRAEIANCSITAYEFDPAAGKQGKLRLTAFNFVAPLEAEGAAVTSAPDVKGVRG